MALIKMIFLLVMITMMDFHGIIYRGIKQKKDADYQGRITDINPLILHKESLAEVGGLLILAGKMALLINIANCPKRLAAWTRC